MRKLKISNLKNFIIFIGVLIINLSGHVLSAQIGPAIKAKSIVSEKDTSAIILKAKILTLTNYGLVLNDSIMFRQIIQQPHKLIIDESKTVYLIEVINTQSFYFPKDSSSYAVRPMGIGCIYRLIFSTETSKFYRIQGFSFSDILEFKNDIGSYQYLILERDERFSFIKCFSKKKNDKKDCCLPCNETNYELR